MVDQAFDCLSCASECCGEIQDLREEELMAPEPSFDDEDCSSASSDADFDEYMASDVADRMDATQQSYIPAGATHEFVESQYWHTRVADAGPSLIQPNMFWADFTVYCARWGLDHVRTSSGSAPPFLSKHLPLATRNLHEILLALAVAGLTFEAPAPGVSVGEGQLVFTPKCAALMFCRDVSDAPRADASEAAGLMVATQYFDPRDRVGERPPDGGPAPPKYISTGEFAPGRAYGALVVVANVTPTARTVQVLYQVPEGSSGLLGAPALKSKSLSLRPYSSETFEYQFYWPEQGVIDHYPAVVSVGGKVLCSSEPRQLRITVRPAVQDTDTWPYVAAHGTLDQVVQWVLSRGIPAGQFHLALWRARESATNWAALVGAARARGMWDTALWGYAVYHADAAGMLELIAGMGSAVATSDGRESVGAIMGAVAPAFAAPGLLFASEGFVSQHKSTDRVWPQLGAQASWVATGALRVNTTGQHGDASYEHSELDPVINARAHALGGTTRKILNQRQEAQWKALLGTLAHKSQRCLTAGDALAIVYHYLLQQRVHDAARLFVSIPAPDGSVVRELGITPAQGLLDSDTAKTGLEFHGQAGTWQVLQYDYMAAYLEAYAPGIGVERPVAAAVAAKYASYPVARWRRRFADLAELLHDAVIPGSAAATSGAVAVDSTPRVDQHADEADEDNAAARERRVRELANAGPTLDVEPEGRGVQVNARGIRAVTARWYELDVEFLFSHSPFTDLSSSASAGSSSSGRRENFTFVRANRVETHELEEHADGGCSAYLRPPADMTAANLVVEVTGGGCRGTAPCLYAQGMRVSLSAASGRVQVRRRSDGAPLPGVYVKVYSRGSGSGSAGKFWKDGYTSARGDFDYVSLNTGNLGSVQEFAVLVYSPEHGAVVKRAAPPSL